MRIPAQPGRPEKNALNDHGSENHAIRLHRTKSWIRCADEQDGNPDLQFISLWIAFNACYCVDDEQGKSLSERKIFDLFVRKLVEHDQDRKIYESLWSTFSGPIRTLINNQYVFQPFWEAHRLGYNENHWKLRFERAKHAANHYLV